MNIVNYFSVNMADIVITQKEIESRIVNIRSQQVMLDSDLAEYYGVETKALNRTVKRNIERFPEEFMFQLTKEEFEALRYHFGTLNEISSFRYQTDTLKNDEMGDDSLRSQNATIESISKVEYLKYILLWNLLKHENNCEIYRNVLYLY